MSTAADGAVWVFGSVGEAQVAIDAIGQAIIKARSEKARQALRVVRDHITLAYEPFDPRGIDPSAVQTRAVLISPALASIIKRECEGFGTPAAHSLVRALERVWPKIA